MTTSSESLLDALRAVGLPDDASIETLISHHRANAALAAGFDELAWKASARKHSDATDGYDGSLSEHGKCLICDALDES